MVAQLRWGILGAGAIAATVAPDITGSPASVLAAVAARDLGRAQAFATAFGAARAYGSYQELVEDPEVDVVYIATTHAQHRDHALLALEAGKPVLVEKAFALNAAQGAEIVAAARRARLFCMEAMWMRFDPLVRRAVELAHGGAIGDIVGVHGDLSRRFDYDPAGRLFDPAAGGGALLDLGVYPVTFAWLVLGRPDSITATGSLAPTGVDATAALQWGYRDGRFAQLHSSAVAASPHTGVIIGTDGWLRLESRIHCPTALTVHSGSTEEIVADPHPGSGYDLEIAEVERCLGAGELESPLVPLDDTLAILGSIDEARRQLGVRYAAEER